MLELEQNSEGFHAAGSHSQAGACRQWGFLCGSGLLPGGEDLGTQLVPIPKW